MTERIIEVVWEDSASTGDWANKAEVESLKPILIRTVGFVSEDSPTMLRVVADVPAEPDGGTQSRVLAIPRSAIREVRELRRGRANPKRR